MAFSRSLPSLAQSGFMESGSDMAPLPCEISYGDTLYSSQTLHTKLSPPKTKSEEHISASVTQSNSGSAPGWRDGATLAPDPSFEVDQVGDIRAVDSGWMDDEIEEVMVVKKKRRKPLSVIMEAAEAVPISPVKSKKVGGLDASDFEYIRTLHVGESGESLIARNVNTGRVYTVKLARKVGYNADGLVARIKGEQKIFRVLTECGVPFVAKLYWSFEDERAMYIVIDWTGDRTLQSVVSKYGPLLPHEAIICAAELAEGIAGLHAHGIVHAKLCPESVLIGEDGHVLVADLGNAVFLYDDAERYFGSRARRSSSAREYQAPELMLGWEYDYAVDWWGFGLLLYWTMTGTHPFVHLLDMDHPEIVRSKILHANLTDDRLGMDESAYQLIYRCLQRNPALRIDGLEVKMHEYFNSVNWEEVVTKQVEAPFARQEQSAMQDLYELDPAEEAEPQLSRRRHLVPQEEPFAFDWQLVSSSASVPDSGDVSRIRGRLQALHTDSNLSNETLKLRDAAVSLTIDITVPDEDVLDVLDIASAEFGTLPDGVSGTSAKIGRLRRYSSLNFELESSTSGTSLQPGLDDSARELAPSPFRLRHARSILGLSLGNTEEDLSSVSWASKLRRRTRPEADSPAVDLQPEPELPKGVKRIGDGIGYTRRADVRRSVLSLGSLTPRTCQGLFKLGGKRKQKKGTPGASDGDAQRERVDAPADELYEDDGDPMDEVMREIYGDDWAAGTSPPADVGPASVRVCERGGGRVGLGWDSGPLRGYGMSPVDASFAGADSTLRLVSPSTPRLGLLDV